MLTTFLSPTAIERNGSGYVWRFGQTVALSRIASEVFNLSLGDVFDVDITSPTLDITMSSRELPLFDAAGSNITIIAPTFVS
jgi:hypothetical protein